MDDRCRVEGRKKNVNEKLRASLFLSRSLVLVGADPFSREISGAARRGAVVRYKDGARYTARDTRRCITHAPSRAILGLGLRVTEKRRALRASKQRSVYLRANISARGDVGSRVSEDVASLLREKRGRKTK